MYGGCLRKTAIAAMNAINLTIVAIAVLGGRRPGAAIRHDRDKHFKF